jgi:TRAP-type C4-dicarboxylate transport system permease small subunit
MSNSKAFTYGLYRTILKAETGILVALLLAMILLAVMQIILRNFFDSGVIWAESLVRITVLWLALVGAMIASRKRQHIAVDALIIHFSEATQRFIRRITDTFTALICFVISYYSFIFVVYEYDDGGLAFAQVPNWLCEAIIPVAFITIASRYLLSAIFGIANAED